MVDTGRLDLDLPDAAVLSDLDPDALAIVARNLIDNALRHGATGSPVYIRLDPDGQFTVANDGPPVPAETLARLTDRFARAGSAEGSGHGLAIVAAIARRSGGTLTLHSPRPDTDSGFEAVVRIPRSAEA